ncbi:MAG TPA: hypothetical protein VIA18_28230 [Polyangia bacterium]|jgi:hypothetical protein|nr:hypothetical protein [Polyangia bacterium]
MANHVNSGPLLSGATFPVSTFSAYSVYAASTSTVTTTVTGGGVATYTVPTAGVLTINDLADTVSVNAAFEVVGLVSVTRE